MSDTEIVEWLASHSANVRFQDFTGACTVSFYKGKKYQHVHCHTGKRVDNLRQATARAKEI